MGWRLARRQELNAQSQELEERQRNLLDAVERGTLTDQIVQGRLREIQDGQRSLREQIETLYAAETIPSLPDLQAILELAKGIDENSQESHRELLERLLTSVEIDPRKRLLAIGWKLGGSSQYRVPQFKGGPGRSVERSMETARERLPDYRKSNA